MSPWSWRGQPPQTTTDKPKRVYRVPGLVTPINHLNNITIVGAAQGEVDRNKRDALKRSMP